MGNSAWRNSQTSMASLNGIGWRRLVPLQPNHDIQWGLNEQVGPGVFGPREKDGPP